jgi:hypothetical protein
MNRNIKTRSVLTILTCAVLIALFGIIGTSGNAVQAEQMEEIEITVQNKGDKIPLAYTDGVLNVAEGVDGYDAEVMSGTRIP